MSRTAPVNVVSSDPPRWVGLIGEGALASACARTRSIERRDAAAGSPHEAVIHTARIKVTSHRRTGLVEA